MTQEIAVERNSDFTLATLALISVGGGLVLAVILSVLMWIIIWLNATFPIRP